MNGSYNKIEQIKLTDNKYSSPIVSNCIYANPQHFHFRTTIPLTN